MKIRKILCLTLTALMVLSLPLLFAGCSSGSNDMWNGLTESSGFVSSDSAAAPEMPAVDPDYVSGGYAGNASVMALAADAGRKLIWSGSMELETLEYDQSEQTLFELVSECGGYIESSSRSGGNVDRSTGERTMRYGSFTVRIPADKFQYFIDSGSSVATVLSTSTSSDDVTDSYFDAEARLNVLQVKEERLLAMLEEGGELEYLIQIENELANTRYEIESITSTLRRYDGLIDYSTIDVYLREVKNPTAVAPQNPQSTWERISARFSASLQNVGNAFKEIFIFVAGYSPILLIVAVVIVGIILLAVLPTRRRRKHAAALAALANAAYASAPAGSNMSGMPNIPSDPGSMNYPPFPGTNDMPFAPNNPGTPSDPGSMSFPPFPGASDMPDDRPSDDNNKN